MPARPPQIVVAAPTPGELQQRHGRLRGTTYRDCSTIVVVPAIKPIPPKVVLSWFSMIRPMNQKFYPLFVENMEVGEAYQWALETILAHPDLSTWKYLMTLETDNTIWPDCLIQLIEDIESGPWAAVGAIYYCKGEGGPPMCYGRPDVLPRGFVPFRPPDNSVTECNGLGMGATLFRLSALKDPRLPKPLFKTVQDYQHGRGVSAYTQDLYAFEQLSKLGYRFACSTRTAAGHYSYEDDFNW